MRLFTLVMSDYILILHAFLQGFFSYLFSSDTKESAFVYALASAALTFTISKACFSGKIYSCACSNKPIFVQADKADQVRQRDFGGCPDITLKGIKFSRQFAFAEMKKKHARHPISQQRQRIKKHNIRLGGQVFCYFVVSVFLLFLLSNFAFVFTFS